MGGGSQQSPTSTVTQQTTLPAYAQPYFTDLMQRGQAVTNQPYQAYNGPRLADFTPLQNQAFAGAAALPGQATSNAATSQSMISNANSMLTGPGYTANPISGVGALTSQNWIDPGVAQSYMNPYLSQYQDNVINKANQQYGDQSLARMGQQAKTGAFGGDRRFVQDSLAQRDFNNQTNDLLVRGNMDAYNTGAGIFNLDRNAGIDVGKFNTGLMLADEQNRQEQERLLQGRAAGIGSLATANSNIGSQGIADLMKTLQLQNTFGTQQQQRTQAGYDLGYQDFVNQRDYERQNLNFMGGLLNGVPVSASSNTSNYENPNPYSQLLGLGVNALALQNATGGARA